MDKQSFIDRLTNWMRGRNGSDELGNTVLGFSILLLLINVFARAQWLSLVAFVAAVYACWRTSSTNISARRKENRAFLKLVGPLATWLHDPASSFAELRSYRHLTCPSCHQKMRVPRGKGKMRVTCPSCHKKFDARS